MTQKRGPAFGISGQKRIKLTIVLYVPMVGTSEDIFTLYFILYTLFSNESIDRIYLIVYYLGKHFICLMNEYQSSRAVEGLAL